MVMRVIGEWIGGEAPRRAVLEALIQRQDDEVAGAAQAPLHQDAGEVGLGAGIVAFVMGQNLANARRHLHGIFPSLSSPNSRGCSGFQLPARYCRKAAAGSASSRRSSALGRR